MLLDLIFTCTEKDCLMKWKHFRFLQVKVAKLRPPMTRELNHSKRCLYCFPSDKIINFAFFFWLPSHLRTFGFSNSKTHMS